MAEFANEVIVERIDFKEFPKPSKNKALGMFFGKITHGMTCNYFSDFYYGFDLGNDGEPSFSTNRAINAISYSLSSEVLVALKYLSGCGFFEDSVDFFIEDLEPWGEVKARGWAKEWNISASVDLAYFLDDLCQELELVDRCFSTEWYYAKISHLYFLDGELPDVAFSIGILLAQMWVKADSEVAAMRGRAQKASLEKATKASREQFKIRSDARNAAIIYLWRECLGVHGAEVMRRDLNAAHAIHILANERRPKELMLKSSGEILSVEAIRKRVASLRKLGELG